MGTYCNRKDRSRWVAAALVPASLSVGSVVWAAARPSLPRVDDDAALPSPAAEPAGFEVSLDVATLSGAVDRLAQEAHFRIAGFVMPPVNDGAPWVGTLSMGAVWY